MKIFGVFLSILFLLKLFKSSRRNPIEYLRSCYGGGAVKIYRNYENTRKKKTKTELDLEFLIKCKVETRQSDTPSLHLGRQVSQIQQTTLF